jgi:hypothetical protein
MSYGLKFSATWKFAKNYQDNFNVFPTAQISYHDNDAYVLLPVKYNYSSGTDLQILTRDNISYIKMVFR